MNLVTSPLFRLWCANLCNLLATGAWLVALPLIVINKEQPAQVLGLSMAAYLIGSLVALFVGGTLADHFQKPKVLGLSAAGTSALLVITALGENMIFTHTIILAFLLFGTGFADAIYGPTSESIVPELASSKSLTKANSWLNIGESVAAKIAGPSLAGVLFFSLGSSRSLLILAFFAGTSALLTSTLPTLIQRERNPMPNPFKGFTDGLRVIAQSRWLFVGLLWSAIALLFQYGTRTVTTPFLLRGHGSESSFSVAMTFLGVGAVVGGLVMVRVGNRLVGFKPMLTLWICGSLPWFLVAMNASIPLVYASFLIMGIFNAAGNVSWSTMLQTKVKDDFRGRVASADWLVSISLMPLSTALAGTLPPSWIPVTITLAAALPTALGILFLLGGGDTQKTA